jgi:hypothetical protein
MKTYMPNVDRLYPDASAIPVPNHPDRAIISVSNHMSIYEFYPRDDDGWATDGSILFRGCMGFDPEVFDPKSEETRKWVEEWSYPLETTNRMVSQINQEAKG